MKHLFIIVAALCCLCAGPVTQPIYTRDQIIRALHLQENHGAATVPAHEDKGSTARGPFQIHLQYFKDSRVPGRFEDCDDYDYSLRVLTAYMLRYEPTAWKNNDAETIARCHNGGPNWRKHPRATTGYWNSVKKYLE